MSLLINSRKSQPRTRILRPVWFTRRRCTTRHSALMIAKRGCLRFWRSARRGSNIGRTRIGISLHGGMRRSSQSTEFGRGRRSFLGWQRSENSKPFPDLHSFPAWSCVQPCRSRDEPLATLPATDFTSWPTGVLPPIKALQEFSKLFNYEPSCIQNFKANFR